MADKFNPYKTGHFIIPNAITDPAEEPLTHEEFRIYIMLCRFASSYKLVFPSYAKIREHCNIGSNTTVKKALDGLVEKGLLHIQARKHKGTNAKSSNIYTVLNPQVNRKVTDESECPVCGCNTRDDQHKKTPAALENTGVDGIGCPPRGQTLSTGWETIVHGVDKGFPPDGQEIDLNKYMELNREGGGPPKPPPPPPQKYEHGRFKKVMLTPAEYGSLVKEYGQEAVTSQITKLDLYIAEHECDNRYKNHYATLHKWFNDDAERAKTNAKNGQAAQKNRFINYEERKYTPEHFKQVEELEKQAMLNRLRGDDGE